MSKRAFLTICTIGLTLGLALIYGGVAAQGAAARGLLTATPTPTPLYPGYGGSDPWSGLSYALVIRQLTYSVAQFKNDFQALISVPIVLIALLAVQLLRTLILGRFEIEAPLWRRLLKWTVMYGVAIVAALFLPLGLWPLALPLGWTALDLGAHLAFCRREGIHPIHATPRAKLYALKGWKWPE